MFEKLKNIFCIHSYVPISQSMQRDGMNVHVYCKKCGKGKLIKIK